MTTIILMSIHKKHADRIYSGMKTLEIRKTKPFAYRGEKDGARYPVKVLLYETLNSGGAGRITGHFMCDCIFSAVYFEAFVKGSCLTLAELMEYAGDADTLHALHISSAVRYDKPETLSQYGLNKAPQSWRYLKVNGG